MHGGGPIRYDACVLRRVDELRPEEDLERLAAVRGRLPAANVDDEPFVVLAPVEAESAAGEFRP